MSDHGVSARVVERSGSHRVYVAASQADEAVLLAEKLDYMVGVPYDGEFEAEIPVVPTLGWLIPALVATAVFLSLEEGNLGPALLLWALGASPYALFHKKVRVALHPRLRRLRIERQHTGS